MLKLRPLAPSFMLIILGFLGVSNVTHQPAFALVRNVDIIKLLGCGGCFGVAIMAIAIMLRGQRLLQ